MVDEIGRKRLFLLGLAVLITCVIFWPALNGPFVLDDQSVVVENGFQFDLKEVINTSLSTHLRERTLSQFSFWINRDLFGTLSTLSYHIIDLLLHLVNGVLVFLFIIKLPRRRQDTGKQNWVFAAGIFACILFLWHPIQSQAVNYITQRMTQLEFLFHISALIVYLDLRISSTKRAIRIGFLFLLIALASLSKPTSMTLLFQLFFIELLIVQAIKGKRGWIVVWALLSLMAITYVVFIPGSIDTPRIAPIDYALTQVFVIAQYLRLIVWPSGQSFDHIQLIWPQIKVAYLLLSISLHVIIVGLAVVIRKNQKMLAFGIGLFYTGLIMESSFIPLKDVMVEHRLYLSMLGVCVVFAWAIEKLLARGVSVKFIWVPLIALSMACMSRNVDWSNKETLWAATLETHPNSARALYSLSQIRLEQKDTATSIQLLKQSIRSDKNHVPSLSALALHYLKVDRLIDAENLLDEALYLEPNYVPAIQNKGYSAELQKKPKLALSFYRKSVRIGGQNPNPHLDYGTQLIKVGGAQEALAQFRLAEKKGLSSARLYNNWGYAAHITGDDQRATQLYNKALEVDPNYNIARDNLEALSANQPAP